MTDRCSPKAQMRNIHRVFILHFTPLDKLGHFPKSLAFLLLLLHGSATAGGAHKCWALMVASASRQRAQTSVAIAVASKAMGALTGATLQHERNLSLDSRASGSAQGVFNSQLWERLFGVCASLDTGGSAREV